MKINKSTLIVFGLLLLATSLYRVWDGRPWGFTPQFAIAIFAGAIVKDRLAAFILPLLSMFLSDVLYEVLYVNNLSDIRGFYSGQLINYALIVGSTLFGMLIRRPRWYNVSALAIATPTLYFILSNLVVWLQRGIDVRTLAPLSPGWDGLMQSYTQALPFYWGTLAGTVFFSGLFFAAYYLFSSFSYSTSTSR
jgi:hypothetical protein